jgi:hypothetical protein
VFRLNSSVRLPVFNPPLGKDGQRTTANGVDSARCRSRSRPRCTPVSPIDMLDLYRFKVPAMTHGPRHRRPNHSMPKFHRLPFPSPHRDLDVDWCQSVWNQGRTWSCVWHFGINRLVACLAFCNQQASKTCITDVGGSTASLLLRTFICFLPLCIELMRAKNHARVLAS